MGCGIVLNSVCYLRVSRVLHVHRGVSTTRVKCERHPQSTHGHPVVIRCAKSGCDSSSSTKIDYKRVQFERVCTLFIYTHHNSAHRTRCPIVHTLFISRLSTLYARYVSVFAGNPFFSMPFFHKSSFVYCALWCILCSLACSRVYFARIHFSSFVLFRFLFDCLLCHFVAGAFAGENMNRNLDAIFALCLCNVHQASASYWCYASHHRFHCAVCAHLNMQSLANRKMLFSNRSDATSIA